MTQKWRSLPKAKEPLLCVRISQPHQALQGKPPCHYEYKWLPHRTPTCLRELWAGGIAHSTATGRGKETEIQQRVQSRTDKGQFTHHMLWDNCSYCYVVDTVDQLQSSLDHFMICLRRLFLWFKFFRNAFTLKLNTRNVSLVPNGWYNYLQTLPP